MESEKTVHDVAEELRIKRKALQKENDWFLYIFAEAIKGTMDVAKPFCG